jgi:predicted small lipoprotein YifL
VKVVIRWSLGVLFLVSFVACGTSRPLMPVPESLEATSDVMQVQRRQTLGPLRFGDWQVTHFRKRGFPSRSRWSTGTEPISFSKSRGKAAYEFVMTSSDREEWECSCRFERVRRDLGVGWLGDATLTYEESLDCELQRAGEEPWRLQIDGSLAIGGQGFTGTLVQGSRTLSLEPNHVIEGLGRVPGPPMGYLFLREGEEVASAELIMPGHVRISDGAGDDRDLIATAAAALLMQPSVD